VVGCLEFQGPDAGNNPCVVDHKGTQRQKLPASSIRRFDGSTLMYIHHLYLVLVGMDNCISWLQDCCKQHNLADWSKNESAVSLCFQEIITAMACGVASACCLHPPYQTITSSKLLINMKASRLSISIFSMYVARQSSKCPIKVSCRYHHLCNKSWLPIENG